MDTPDSTPEPDSAELPRKVAGRYVIKRLLGRGGFGSVYEAFDEFGGRSVALKAIRKDLGAGSGSQTNSKPDSQPSQLTQAPTRSHLMTFGSASGTSQDARERSVNHAFREEFRLLTHLHHPNLAEVYDFGRCDELDGTYFTQELVEGVGLSEVLKRADRHTIVEVFLQLTRALDYLHALGLLHGDLKPSNVLVTVPEGADTEPEAKLIDFGLAKVFRGVDKPDGPDPDKRVVVGTPGYTAPEKIEGKGVDARSDLYALASTLYTAIRGQKPFPAKSFKEALRHQQSWRPEFAGAIVERCGPVIAELIGRMLQPDPDARPQSARAIVLEVLRREQLGGGDDAKSDRDAFARLLVEQLPFVDRDQQLSLLLSRATTVLHGSPAGELNRSTAHTVIIQAPEGMGKQRLVAEARREIQLGDGAFIETSCWDSAHPTLGPFAPVVRQLAAAVGERTRVVRRFNDLLKLARSRRSADPNAAERLGEFLLACAARRPFVLHLAHIDHADEQTRVQFEQLCRVFHNTVVPVLLIGTTQPRPRVTPLLSALERDGVAEIWRLRPMARPEMTEMLQGLLGDTPVLPELVTMLDQLTGGHPLSLRETLRVLIEDNVLVRDADSWVLSSASTAAEELHQTLAQRSQARLDTLGPSAWELTSLLYLIATPIEETRLTKLADLRKERFRRTLERLEGEGLVSRNAASGHCQLAHASVREAVRLRYGDALDETRLDLAQRIEQLGMSSPDMVFLRARLLDEASDGLAAADELEQAANQLFDQQQPGLGAQILERVVNTLRVHGGTENLPRLLRAELTLLDRGAGALDDPAREAEHYQAGILIAELLGDHRAQARFWLGLADRYTGNAHDDAERTLVRLENATAAARRARDRVLELRIANRRAELLMGTGQLAQALKWSEAAMGLFDLESASDTDRSSVAGVRLRCLALSGRYDDARALHALARPIAARTPVMQRQSYLSGIAYVGVLSGDPALAVPETESAVEELRGANIPRLLMAPLHNLADFKLRVGDLKGAEEAFREALNLATLYGHDYHSLLNRGFLGYVLARQGSVEEGAAMLADARRDFGTIQGEQVALQQIRLLDAEVAHMQGHTARARRQLDEMLVNFETTHEASLAGWARDALARIERDVGTRFVSGPDDEGEVSDPDEETVPTRPMR